MFDHIGIRVKDLAAAVRLYKAMLAPLGHKPDAAGDGYAGFGVLWLHQEPRGGGAHVAFSASSRAAVDAFHTAGVEAGAKDNGRPGLRTDYARRTTPLSSSTSTATTSRRCARLHTARKSAAAYA